MIVFETISIGSNPISTTKWKKKQSHGEATRLEIWATI